MRSVTASSTDGNAARWLLALLLLSLPLEAQEPGEAGSRPAGEGAESRPGEAQEDKEEPGSGSPVTAYFVRRAVTVSGDPVEQAVILVQDGRIAGIGKQGEVEVPPFAERVERRDLVVMPGLVNPASLAMTGATSYSTSGNNKHGDRTAKELLDPTSEQVERLAARGFTTLHVPYPGGGLAGQGVLVRPVDREEGYLPVEDVLAQDGVSLVLGFEPRTSSKGHFKKLLEAARKYIKDLAAYEKAMKQKAAEQKKKGGEGDKAPGNEKKPGKDGGSGKKEKPRGSGEAEKTEKGSGKGGGQEKDKKQEESGGGKDGKKGDKGPEKPEEDPKLMPLVEVLRGRLRAFLALEDAAAFLHAEYIFELEKGFRPVLVMGHPGNRGSLSQRVHLSHSGLDAWRVLDRIKELGLAVIMPTSIATRGHTSSRRVTQRNLLDAGVPVALVPGTPAGDGYPGFRFHLMELVRHGVPEKQVLRAVTLTPAEILGIQESCGSLETGKRADMLFFTGDPLDPTAQLVEVMVGGEKIHSTEKDRT